MKTYKILKHARLMEARRRMTAPSELGAGARRFNRECVMTLCESYCLDGVYVFSLPAGCLYIGSSKNVAKRVVQSFEARDLDRPGLRLTLYLLRDPLHLQLERHLIRTLRPSLNRTKHKDAEGCPMPPAVFDGPCLRDGPSPRDLRRERFAKSVPRS